MLDAKQIKNLWSYPSIERPYSKTVQASWGHSFHDCSIIYYNNFTEDGYAVGNMGSSASFILIFYDIPETKTYDFELTYACGNSEVTNVTIELIPVENPLNAVTITPPVTANWITYGAATGSIQLKKGVNLLRIRRGGASEGFNTSKLRISEAFFSEYINVGTKFYRELLNVTTQNVIPDLSKNPTAPSKVFLIINGQIQDAIAPGESFTVAGKAIALTENIGFSVLPGARVVAFYETEE